MLAGVCTATQPVESIAAAIKTVNTIPNLVHPAKSAGYFVRRSRLTADLSEWLRQGTCANKSNSQRTCTQPSSSMSSQHLPATQTRNSSVNFVRLVPTDSAGAVDRCSPRADFFRRSGGCVMCAAVL